MSTIPPETVPAADGAPSSAARLEPDQLREVALRISRYFRDFLESDFKRAQAPRRRIVLTAESGFRAGMRTSHYAALDAELWQLLARPSGDELRLTIGPRKYTRPVSATLRKVIREQVAAIEEAAVQRVRAAVEAAAVAGQANAAEDAERWVEAVQDALLAEIATQLVRPLLAHLAGSLQQQAYWVADSLHAAESDLVARVGADFHRLLPDLLARLLAQRDIEPLREACRHQLTLDAVQTALSDFFEHFVAADAYQEFRDLDTYVSTGDGLQLYLYIGTLRFRGQQYPLFHLPLEVERAADGTGYTLRVVNHLFANRRAIDYVLQELAAGLQRSWTSPVQERINYLLPEQSLLEAAQLLFRQVANAMDLGGRIELAASSPEASNAQVALSAALHLAAYERSDEALLNDFEDIIDQARRGGSALVDLFHGMVDAVLMRNPVPIAPQVEADWDALPLVDRLVFDAPIPLNEEQRKVLLAMRRPEGRIVVVEGPPGTGKSHTITAIAADCAFERRSCLVLSDKTEALDVVVDKLSEAMSRVRDDRDFPNPILRLGQQAANFRRLTSNQTVTRIGHYARAMKANQPKLEAERKDAAHVLKSAIADTVATLGAVSLAMVKTVHQQETELARRAPQLLDELQRAKDAAVLPELEALLPDLEPLQAYLAGLFEQADYDTPRLLARVRRDRALIAYAREHRLSDAGLLASLDEEQLRQIGLILLQYQQLKMPVFGHLFRGRAVRALEMQLNALPVTRPLLLRREADALHRLVVGANALRIALEQADVPETFAESYRDLARGALPPPAAETAQRVMALLARINPLIVDAMLAQPKDDPVLWPLALRFLYGWLTTRAAFLAAPDFDYIGTKSRLERLNTSALNTQVDTRLLAFMDEHRSDARALAGVIANRQKFPVEKFEAVRESFPVIVASIREFGQYMPLVPDLFDVVVIDEASQVSVAQALPALLRARKVVVLGDSRQFSNVKAANASTALNEKYRADISQYFRSRVSDEAATLQRLAMFDVKRSVLEFCSLAASYTVMLRKHFRSYPELIGYSSSTFYGGQLQALKIRAAPLDEVIRFSEVSVDHHRATRNINEAECEFLLQRLLERVDEPSPPTVGIITPFREQQALLSKRLFGHLRGRDFEDRLRLKVMTFDSCQGEERRLVFYSMVASPGQDALNYVFPASLENPEDSVEEKLRVQRLNVGFSRAQHAVWFVHSMPLDAFRGAIGQALAFYANTLRQSSRVSGRTDPRSPMETKVLEWLQQTPFVQRHGDAVQILPQFPVGDYLRQLDPTYQHPAWRVDFLVTVRTGRDPVQIVVEYDGFEHHFQPGRDVHVGNHERYLVEADVERQLTLESYGYRFVRINRFNLGADPVRTLSERLYRLMEMAGADPVSAAVEDVLEQAAGLASRELKPCKRCGEIREQSDFFDPALRAGSGGYGRICMPCKSGARSSVALPA